MKTLQTLIKIHKQKLDALRRNLSSLESQKNQLLELAETLEKELADEITLAEKSSELATFFGDYIKRIRERQDRVRKEVAGLDVQMDATRGAIRIEYGEQLKYEHIMEEKIKQQQAEADRKEGLELDEIAAQQHARKEEV